MAKFNAQSIFYFSQSLSEIIIMIHLLPKSFFTITCSYKIFSIAHWPNSAFNTLYKTPLHDQVELINRINQLLSNQPTASVIRDLTELLPQLEEKIKLKTKFCSSKFQINELDGLKVLKQKVLDFFLKKSIESDITTVSDDGTDQDLPTLETESDESDSELGVFPALVRSSSESRVHRQSPQDIFSFLTSNTNSFNIQGISQCPIASSAQSGIQSSLLMQACTKHNLEHLNLNYPTSGYDLIEAKDDNGCLFNVFSLILMDIGKRFDYMEEIIRAYLNLPNDVQFTTSHHTQQFVTSCLRQKLKYFIQAKSQDSLYLSNILSSVRCNYDSVKDTWSDQDVLTFYLAKIEDKGYWMGLETAIFIADMLFEDGIIFNVGEQYSGQANRFVIITDYYQENLDCRYEYGIINTDRHFDCLKRAR